MRRYPVVDNHGTKNSVSSSTIPSTHTMKIGPSQLREVKERLVASSTTLGNGGEHGLAGSVSGLGCYGTDRSVSERESPSLGRASQSWLWGRPSVPDAVPDRAGP